MYEKSTIEEDSVSSEKKLRKQQKEKNTNSRR